jgi:hypothetical protein
MDLQDPVPGAFLGCKIALEFFVGERTCLDSTKNNAENVGGQPGQPWGAKDFDPFGVFRSG